MINNVYKIHFHFQYRICLVFDKKCHTRGDNGNCWLQVREGVYLCIFLSIIVAG